MSRLGDCVEITSGFPFPSAQFSSAGGGQFLVRGDNIGHGDLRKGEGRSFWWQGEVDERFALSMNDVLVAMDRPWISSGLKFAVVREDFLPALLVQRVARLRAGSGSEQRFLAYVVRDQRFAEYLQSVQTGTGIPHVSAAQIGDFPVDMPDLATQTAIADVLGALDDKIAANDRVIRLSEDLLLTRFLHECDQAKQTRRVSDILDFNPPRPRPVDVEPIYVEMKDLGTHTSVITSWSTRAPLGGVRFQRGDTVMGRITPCLENGKVGYVDFLPEGEIGIGSTEFIAMSSRDGLPKPLSFLVAEHPGFRQEAVQLMVGTSGRQRVSARDLGEIELQLPDDGALRQLGRAAEAVFELLARLRNENRSLAATRDALLPGLMSGRILVEEDSKAR